MENVALGGLVAHLDRSAPSVLRVRLTGRSANREADRILEPFFERVLGEAKAESRTLVLHFERLEYFNSSTIVALMRFIRIACEDGVDLTVVYDGRERWQAMSFEALRRTVHRLETCTGGKTVEFSEA